MPATSAGITAAIVAGLAGVSFTGQDVPRLAQGLGNGLLAWMGALTVVTTDTGSGGVGTGFLPWVISSQLITTNLLTSYPGNGHSGSLAPLEATGLGIGFSTGFAQAAIVSQHPTVGTGAAIARVIPNPSFTYLIQGLSGVGITGVGASQKASAISQALLTVLAVSTWSVPIVGSASPSATSGVGVGRIL